MRQFSIDKICYRINGARNNMKSRHFGRQTHQAPFARTSDAVRGVTRCFELASGSALFYQPVLALLWQKFSQGYAELNHLRQCGQREGRARVM
jgi:hypothetical protein